MKTELTIKKEFDIRSIIIDIHIRYVGDGDDYDVQPDFPLLNGNQWNAVVLVDTGKIIGWPQGEEREMYCKVCDAGKYTIFDENGEVKSFDGYVPNGVVPGEYGDYVHLIINSEGYITNWPEKPDFSAFNVIED